MTSGLCACGCGLLPPPGCLFVPGHAAPSAPVRRTRAWPVPLAVAGAVVALGLVGAALPEQEPVRRATPVAVVATPGEQEDAAARSPAARPTPAEPEPVPPAPGSDPAEPPPAPAPPPQEPAPAQAPLLVAAAHGDGDSWRDTAGREYRLGLVNTPEQGDCYGAQATAERKAQVAAGFRAKAYATDDYGREVSVVTTASGLNLNVHLARRGFADDRYLARFRHENPALARQLDAAFAAAKAEGAGLWSACRRADQPRQAPPAPAPAAPAQPDGDCHPDYATCIPLKGDGSGRGAANDLDCGEIDGPVRLRRAGVDPYRLDADGDGVGCD